MLGDYFSHTVTLVIEHNRGGAFELVINKTLDLDLVELFGNKIVPCPTNITVLESGPVGQNRLFFLNTKETMFESSININEQLALTTSLDILNAIAEQKGPGNILAGLGYAGWSRSQLESEIQADVWLVVPYRDDIVFNVPFDKRLGVAANSIGVDLNLISSTPRHG
ncbi:YqgE/AlgH family protein [Gammaproteobacteria bacterium]|nr:YqgE/AlgH family protein [Gammaproteobacteria bacterium]